MSDSINKIRDELIGKLEKSAGMSRNDAKQELLNQIKHSEAEEIAREIKAVEEKVKVEADKRAREIVADAIKHGATDWVSEFTVSTIQIQDDSVKARIIGKEGRNIRAFERVTNVDVNLDEEGLITLSSFDPVRREIARVALEDLIKDGRIQPARIEEIYEQTKESIEKLMFEAGEKLCHGVGVFSMPKELIAMLGRFKYRFSYGQNMIKHTLEETKIGIALAEELRADVDIVRLGCLLHDIGKIVSEDEGTHVDKGVKLLKKYNMPEAVIGCVAAHHEDIPFPSLSAVLVYVADAVSGARPGARHEDYGDYLKRLTKLEDIAKRHTGVSDAYAVSAGRDLRVVVDPGELSDAEATVLARDIKKEVEETMVYPGQVKIIVIRELRAIEIAQ
ncbi:ribonuclease Y [Candidatus Roizmanbacteria bacterium CG22_combo_CG10-13_8_21_14_all_38_20]|uniref:Ribonuclease Y n=1 Tax=Candidatus Roizmanbacteria bacterium CG22_combo_CG10-13_8_21_14_all_38_20 TaxID=1974862 RepID=A0A2H0BWP5_9BACT|nr:ribonuclease Y [Candidatus Microgenomates bacterium]PIP62113.1 MAG: ribonuclease Y [Candidatus Roizmanbacteria bacterium CG22_combo_CG10-13_8_21_14_all_38_20]PJC31839.1 MAG: ribonuclease Y [Candidatus Roizmanbacteria bacterium CG_4_9_14_0_2_um_filter_38_17]